MGLVVRSRIALAGHVVEVSWISRSALDPESVSGGLSDAAQRLKVTSVVISHDIGSALKVADDIAVLHKGEIVEDCTPQELKRSQHPFVREFLDIWFGKQ